MVISAHKLIGLAALALVAAPAAAAESSVTPEAAGPRSGAAPAAPLPPPPPPPRPATPFRLALTYTHVLSESGDRGLVNGALATNALGLVFVSPSTSYVRDHFAIAHQWESAGAYSARGFRIDLVSFGYPIRIVERQDWRIDLEPIVTAVRGEIMFVSDGGGGGRFVRLESGLGLELSATFHHWFLAAQPLAIDFRYWFYGSEGLQPQSRTGLGRLFPMRLAIGHEF